eukprot:1159010-Pelagomonas_calceolata.AAC.8
MYTHTHLQGVPFTDAWAERCKEYGWAELREWWQACPVKRTREVFGLLATVLSGAHALRGEPSPDTVMKVVQGGCWQLCCPGGMHEQYCACVRCARGTHEGFCAAREACNVQEA